VTKADIPIEELFAGTSALIISVENDPKKNKTLAAPNGL
jgi:hypothetical protein